MIISKDSIRYKLEVQGKLTEQVMVTSKTNQKLLE